MSSRAMKKLMEQKASQQTQPEIQEEEPQAIPVKKNFFNKALLI